MRVCVFLSLFFWMLNLPICSMEEQKEYQTLEEVLIEAMQKYHEPELLEDLVNTYRCAKSVQLSKLNFGKGLKSTLPLLVILPRPVINQNKSLSDSE